MGLSDFKAIDENKPVIAAVNRFATQNQVQRRVFPQPVQPRREELQGFGLRPLLPLENLVDGGLAALVDADDFVDRLETGQRDVHDVIPRTQHDIDWR